jgi:hypothetical protein
MNGLMLCQRKLIKKNLKQKKILLQEVKRMSKDSVQDVRIEHIEDRIDRHEMLLEKLTDNQLELSSRLTELATSIDTQNQLIGEGFNLMKRVILGLLSTLSAIMVGTQVM